MTEDKDKPRRSGQQSREDLRRLLAAKQERKLRAIGQRDRNAWFGLGMFGLVGWSVAIPAVALTALGVWIDARHAGPYSWTLMLLVIGVGLGCVNAWFWISRERKEIETQRHEPPKEDLHDTD
ncbi:ATP synthase N, Q subunit [Syntrophotalea carbinolica DSM 2380]|uniref:ATP synthase N, Q subunit n=1 Tax=Syntrophotalea carbinolica (strain DSM 2380 / NBRC 103641 / GraBd1) TaxID=338963 RepID=Q3A081_SYNC1|nr:AtpZ/AtpI family protein [Syntrophotalea carbinolica]ABA90226.1 ATP synthase N, Q subunit [Syntrophotalea carbinolica DSM 2380]